MKLKNLVLALPLLAVGVSQASVINAGALTVGAPDTELVTVLGSGVGSFNDTINFSLSTNVVGEFLASSWSVPAFHVNPVTSLSLSLFKGVTQVVPVSGSYLLAAGNDYSFHVSGNTFNNAQYTVSYKFTPTSSPVPESASVALALAGLAVVAFALRRHPS